MLCGPKITKWPVVIEQGVIIIPSRLLWRVWSYYKILSQELTCLRKGPINTNYPLSCLGRRRGDPSITGSLSVTTDSPPQIYFCSRDSDQCVSIDRSSGLRLPETALRHAKGTWQVSKPNQLKITACVGRHWHHRPAKLDEHAPLGLSDQPRRVESDQRLM